MKPVRCSWVDMQKIKASLSTGEYGEQKALTNMRCVDDSTVCTWKSVVDVMSSVDGKLDICQVSTFQPSHARYLARHCRKLHGKDPMKWPEDTVVGWVEKCEEEEYTVEEFKVALELSLQGITDDVFSIEEEWKVIMRWLAARRESVPSEYRPGFCAFVRRILDELETDECEPSKGSGESLPPPSSSD